MGLFSTRTPQQASSPNAPSEPNITSGHLTESQIKRATRTRLEFGWFTSFCLLVTVVFLILVEIGNTSNTAIIRDIWFVKLDLSNVIPTSIPNSALLNSIAQTLGLHDFYTVGLWNFCEGYTTTTGCMQTQTLYAFNPVTIIENQLIAGASIQLPTEINNYLSIVETVSHLMFSLFLTGACLSFVLMFLLPLTVLSRWVTFALTVLTFFNALFVTVAAVIATVLWVIIQDVFTHSITQVSIGVTIGKEMFAFMWVAAAFSIIAWLFQFGMCCCCASRRDVRRGKKRGSEKAYSNGPTEK